jgi:O-succinylbenzoic acid--CoA ligase
VKRPCPVRAAALRDDEAPALWWAGRRFSYRQYDRLVSSLAAHLEASGVRPGDRVAVRSWNRPEVATLFFALGRLGACLVPINARLLESEAQVLVERAGPRLCFGELPGALPWPALGPLREAAEVDDEAVAAALFTSGTTGTPKLVELTHSNFFALAAASAKRLGSHAAQRWLGSLPMFHIGGLAMVHRCAVIGASVVVESHFDPVLVCAALDSGVSHASFVPTMLARVLDARGESPFEGVQAVLVGGGPMGPGLLERARLKGLPVLQTYGLTEACSQVTTEGLREADGSTAGRPLDGLAVRVVDDAGRELPIGEVGEIEVSGPTVAKGLGPWLQTKDLGRLDAQGRLTVLARRTDLIISGGENVYPAEIEAVLREHPAIEDVAVVPRTDASWGQVPVAMFVPRQGVTDAALDAWVKERLAGFKRPRAWVRTGALPRNANGKLERNKLVQD